MALRNSISRNKDLVQKLIELNIEEILKNIMKNDKIKCKDSVKALLRDMGCDIELKELWTGSGKTLTNI